MKEHQKYFEANKELWNKRTAIHKGSSFYNLDGFKKGETVLTPIELSELGEVIGKKMLHLQCHFGMDSLNWARLGADVTGVDLSDEAINEANQLKDDPLINSEGINAKFICCNVYDLKEHLDEKFDIVYTSYGTIGWLPDLVKWAAIVSHFLKTGGTFYMADFHPVLWMFDDEFTNIKYAYDNQEVIVTESQGTYTDKNAAIKAKEYGWNHSISEILNALIKKGLSIQHFNEFMYSPYPCFSNVVEFEKACPPDRWGKWHIKGLEGKIPMVYSIKAKKVDN